MFNRTPHNKPLWRLTFQATTPAWQPANIGTRAGNKAESYKVERTVGAVSEQQAWSIGKSLAKKHGWKFGGNARKM